MIDSAFNLEQAKIYIYSIDFSKIITKLVDHHGWLKEDAINIAQLYRNFLFLNKKYRHEFGQLPPSEEIDEFWHQHILDTENYHRSCKAIFGDYFHHYPYLGIDGKTNLNDLNNAFKTTQMLHLKEFGEYIYKVKKNKIFYLIHQVTKTAKNYKNKIKAI